MIYLIGTMGKPCSEIAPKCPYSEQELLKAIEDLGISKDNREIKKRWKRQTQHWRNNYNYPNNYDTERYKFRPISRPGINPNRRQSVLDQMPPIFRPRGAESREVCRTCDVRGNVCSVYGIGKFKFCL